MIRRPPRSTLFPYNDALPIFLPGKEVRYTAQEQRIAPESCDRRHEPPRLDPLGVWLRACKAMDPGWHEENRPHRELTPTEGAPTHPPVVPAGLEGQRRRRGDEEGAPSQACVTSGAASEEARYRRPDEHHVQGMVGEQAVPGMKQYGEETWMREV